MVTVRGWIIRETERAVLFVAANRMEASVWLPRSQISITDREWDHVLILPAWLAASNGLKVLPPAPRGGTANIKRPTNGGFP